MPLIQIVYGPDVVRISEVGLRSVAAKALSCESGGQLTHKDIMVEAYNVGTYSSVGLNNCKDVNIRIFANEYPDRRARLEGIRREIADYVRSRLPQGTSWYVWVMLMQASYGSDTED